MEELIVFFENKKDLDISKSDSLKVKVKPEDLLYEIIRSLGGRFHTNSLTIKKSFNKN